MERISAATDSPLLPAIVRLAVETAMRRANVYQLHALARDPRMLMRYYHPRAEDLAKKLG